MPVSDPSSTKSNVRGRHGKAGRASSVTARDVAEALGLSRSTVQYAIQDDPRIKAKTREIVRLMANKMGYRPHTSARMMRKGKTQSIAVLFGQKAPTDQLIASHAIMLQAISRTLDEQKHQFNLGSWFPEGPITDLHDPALPRSIRERSVDGILLIHGNTDLERAIDQIDLPYVVVDDAEAPNRVSVRVDERRAAEMAVEHLASLGHRRIGMLLPRDLSWTPRDTFYAGHYRRTSYITGYMNAMASAGLVPMPGWESTGWPSSSGEHAGEDNQRQYDALTKHPQGAPTAMILFDDQDAIHLSTMLQQRGVHVPRDLSLVILHDLCRHSPLFQGPGWSFKDPTRIVNHQKRLAELALARLFEHIQTPDAVLSPVVIEPTLHVGDSTAPYESSAG